MAAKIVLSFFLLVTTFRIEFTHAQHIAVGIKAGTTGLGGEVTTSLNERLNVRLSGTFFSYEHSDVYTKDDPDIAYNVKTSVGSVGVLADFFPFKKGLKLSAGLFYHKFTVDGDAVPTEAYVMGDKSFPPDKLGSLTANIDYRSKVVPYAGLGFGNPLTLGSRVKVSADLGTMYTNSPRVTMTGEGMIAPTAAQDKDFEDGMRDFKFYPVLNFVLSFRL